MRTIFCFSFLIIVYGLFNLGVAYSQTPQEQGLSAGGPQSSTIFNPNISVIGWFHGQVGNNPTPLDESPAFRLQEAELGLQSVIDPYARADFFISVNDAGTVDLEEGYLTTLSLPYGFQAKLGKFQPDLGKFNRTHTPETYFADRPLAPLRLFGEEPLKEVGASLSHLLPNPWDLYINLDAQALNTPENSEAPVFAKARREDLLYLGRLSLYGDLTESVNITLGSSYANGANGFEVNQVDGSSSTRRNQVAACDLTFRWKNPRRAIYRSFFWQTEFYHLFNKLAPLPDNRKSGGFSHMDYQFARRWHAGARGDWVQRLDVDDQVETGGLIYITFTPSEFSLVSLQGKHVRFFDGGIENIGFLKITFNIGPHGVHPF